MWSRSRGINATGSSLAAHLAAANEIRAISSRHSSSLLSRLSKYRFQIKIISPSAGWLETSLSIHIQYGLARFLRREICISSTSSSSSWRGFLAKHKFLRFLTYLFIARHTKTASRRGIYLLLIYVRERSKPCGEMSRKNVYEEKFCFNLNRKSININLLC